MAQGGGSISALRVVAVSRTGDWLRDLFHSTLKGEQAQYHGGEMLWGRRTQGRLV